MNPAALGHLCAPPGAQIRHAVDTRGARVEGRCKGRAREGRIAPVRDADDTDMMRIGNALVDHDVYAVRDIVLHQAAPLSVSGPLEGLTESGRAAELWL